MLLELGGEEAASALVAGDIDAAFLMGDSATPGDHAAAAGTRPASR